MDQIRTGMAVLGCVVLLAGGPVHAAHGPEHGKPAKPAVAVGVSLDRDGQLWLARVEGRRLLVSKSSDQGQTFSAPVQIVADEAIAADGENRPNIAVAANGTVLLSWTQTLPQNYAGNIRFARSVDGGKTFSSPVTLNDDGRETGHRFDSMTTDGQGRVAVVWLDARDRDAFRLKHGASGSAPTFAGLSLYSAHSPDNGAHFKPNQRVALHTCECCRVATTWSDRGPVAFWRQLFDTHTRDFALAHLDSGTVERATDDEWKISACPHHGGSIAADGLGTLHQVWFTGGSARQGLFYQRTAGKTPTAPLAFGNAARQAGHPAVAASGKLVLLTWREFNGTAYTAHVMRSDDSGLTWRAPMQLAEAANAADYPLPLTDGTRALVVWNALAEGLRVLPVASGVTQ